MSNHASYTDNFNQLKQNALTVISNVLKVKTEDVTEFTVLKNGMTNRSFLFTCRGEKYIIRIPGEGTEQFINRAQEAFVYQVIGEKGICDDNIYINPENGYKITKYIENFRVCNPADREDITKCMKKLRAFHEMKLRVEHEFDIFERIAFYESLRRGIKTICPNYEETKKNIYTLQKYIDAHRETKTLCHIDSVSDNFLFFKDKGGDETVSLIDWEYAGMQDPHVDIAMFAIYSFYGREQIDELIDIYFENNCSVENRIKIYCYVAACGLLWGNWAEYKRSVGVDFGEYTLRQYQYAEEFYNIVKDMLGEKKTEWGIE